MPRMWSPVSVSTSTPGGLFYGVDEVAGECQLSVDRESCSARRAMEDARTSRGVSSPSGSRKWHLATVDRSITARRLSRGC